MLIIIVGWLLRLIVGIGRLAIDRWFTGASIRLIVVILWLGLGHFAYMTLLTVRVSVVFIVSVRVFGRVSVCRIFPLVVAIIIVVINVFVSSLVCTRFSVRILVPQLVVIKLVCLELVESVLVIVYKL